MRPDQLSIEALSEQRRERTITGAGLESIQPPVGKPGNARLERNAKQVCDREDNVGDAAAVDMKRADVDIAVVAEQTVERVHGLAGGASDHCLMQRRIAIGDRGVDLDDGVAFLVRVDLPAGFARAAKTECLAIARGPQASAEPRRYRLGMNGVGQVAERGAECILAHVPRLHPQQRAP